LSGREDDSDDGIRSVLEAGGADALNCSTDDKGCIIFGDGCGQSEFRYSHTTHETANLEDEKGGEDCPLEIEQFIHLSPWALKTRRCQEECCSVLSLDWCTDWAYPRNRIEIFEFIGNFRDRSSQNILNKNQSDQLGSYKIQSNQKHTQT
jgi:hypothetical protein